MRRLLLVISLLVAGGAHAQDARISFLAKQLSTAKDPRVRAQTAVILGGTNSAAAVAPLCAALRDEESVVRSAAASALGELRLQEAIACLKSALGEQDQAVRSALAKAVVNPQVKQGGLYVLVEPVVDKIGSTDPAVLKFAEGLIREQLEKLGASFAPVGEQKAAASALVKSRQLKGFAVRSHLIANGSSGLKLEMLIMTYPDQALQGTWNVKAAGGKQESQLKAMVPRVVDDAATDLEWK